MNHKFNLIDFTHINIRSLCSKFQEFSEFVLDENYDITGISETWLNDSIPDSAVRIPGYKIIRKDRCNDSNSITNRGGGVAFYIKEIYKFRILQTVNSSNIEQLWISLKINGKNLCMGTLYRPPTKNINDVLSELESGFTSFIPCFDCIICGGDLNVDIIGNRGDCVRLKSFLNMYNLAQIITDPTRVTATSSTLIDLIITSRQEFVSVPEVIRMDEDISDHRLVKCKVNIPRMKQSPKFRTLRDFKYFNYQNFLRDIAAFQWETIYSFTNVNQMVDFVTSNLTTIFNIHAPMKTVKISKSPAPWITDNMRLLMRLRNKAQSKYLKSKTDSNWEDYRRLRNLVTLTLRSEKKAYLSHKFKTDPANFWRVLRLLNVNSTGNCDAGAVATADEFATFFTNSIPSINNNNANIFNKYCDCPIPIGSRLSFKEITVNNFEMIFNQIKSNAMGADGLNLRLLSLVIPHLSVIFTFIINACIRQNIFPSLWKVANIIPVAKIESPSNTSHFRPISILPTLSKVLEKVMSEQLSDHLSVHNIIPTTQSGFRSQHSTSTALLKVTDDIIRAYDDNKNTCLILLDYSKAFDLIDHTILLSKLKYFGLNTDSLNLFVSYLQNRKQGVLLDGKVSRLVDTFRGVPQGSILGPLLFTLYTADFCRFLNRVHSHQYADDFQIYHSFNIRDFDNAMICINENLNVISRISQEHGLVLNESKTQMMVFGRERAFVVDHICNKIKINDVFLEVSGSCRNLGVFFDSDLRYKSHVAMLLKRCYSKLRVLYQFKDILTSDVKLKLCESLILSQISYCDTVYWPALLQQDKNTLQKLQNACLRFSFDARKFDHVSPLYAKSECLRLDSRYVIHLCSLIFKIHFSSKPQYLYQKLVRRADVHNRHTRFNFMYTMPKFKTTVFQRSFSYNAVKCYNQLPSTVKNSTSFVTFKKNIRKYVNSLPR